MADSELQRRNMVESQVRPSDVTDRRIVQAMLEIPREAFVPAAVAGLAYSDGEVRLGPAAPGRVPRALLAPRTFAKLVDLARLSASDVVLDVGAATGYSAAIIGRLVETVVALESDVGVSAGSAKVLSSLSADNVALVQGDLAKGWPSAGPYDAIVVEGAVSEVPAALLEQLKEGGRLVAIVDERTSTAVVWHRRGSGFDRRTAFDAAAPRLPGFERKAEFTL